MRKTITLLLFISLILVIRTNLNAQVIHFCTDVDNGNPVNESSTFYITKDGGYFYFLAKLPQSVNCTYVNYKIYELNDDRETYSTTIKVDVQENWTWFSEKVTFYKDGYYKIFLVNCNDVTLTSGTIHIYYK